MNVMEIAKKELDNKVNECVAIIEHKIAESIKSSQPMTLSVTRSDLEVYNLKMFVRICEKVADQTPEGIKVFMETTSNTGELIRIKVDYKDLF